MSKHSRPRILTNNKSEPSVDHEAIKALAYQLWISRGSPIGSDHEDWFRAEEQLKGKEQSSRQAA